MVQPRYLPAVFAGLSLLSACNRTEDPEPERTPANGGVPGDRPVLAMSEAAMDRKALLLAVVQASSNASLGKIDLEAQRKLDGQRFALRLRFGCASPRAEKERPLRTWRWDEKRRVQTFRIVLDFDEKSAFVQSTVSGPYEAVEGFELDRPWVLESACPPPAPAAVASDAPEATDLSVSAQSSPATVTGPRIGIAQFFSQSDARTHRRDHRPYEASTTLAQGKLPSASGYDLVVSGRLRRLADGRVVACKVASALAPPDCIISAQFDDVAIEQPDRGGIIANWSGS